MAGTWDAFYELGKRTQELVGAESKQKRRKAPKVKVPSLVPSSRVKSTTDPMLRSKAAKANKDIRSQAFNKEVDRNLKPYADQVKGISSVGDLMNILLGKDLSHMLQGKKYSGLGAVLGAASFAPGGKAAKPLLKAAERVPKGRLRGMIGKAVVHHGSPYGRVDTPDLTLANPDWSAQAHYTTSNRNYAKSYRRGMTDARAFKEDPSRGRITSYLYAPGKTRTLKLHESASNHKEFWDQVVKKLSENKYSGFAENFDRDTFNEMIRQFEDMDQQGRFVGVTNFAMDESLRRMVNHPFYLDKVYRDLKVQALHNMPSKRRRGEAAVDEIAFLDPRILTTLGGKKKPRRRYR